VIDQKQREKIRLACDALVIASVPISEAVPVIRDKFNLTDQQANSEIDRSLERLLSESERLRPFNRATAERRILGHIRNASKRNQYTAVANLEARLAEIQGTAAPTEHRVQIDARLTQASLNILGAMNQEEVEELIQEELKRMPIAAVEFPNVPTTGTEIVKKTG
jgi:hypothetical protein